MKRFQIINTRRPGLVLGNTAAVALILAFSVIVGPGCSKKSTSSPPVPARIIADLDSLRFEAGITSRALTLRNTGDSSGDFRLGAAESWCSFKDTTGTLSAHASRSIDILVTRSGMAAGTYSSVLRTTTDGSPTDSLVVLMVCPSAPCILSSPDTLDFGATLTSLPLALTNDGNASGSYSLVSTETWLTVDSATGSLAAGASKTVTATVSRIGQSTGTPTARLLVNTGTATTDTVVARMVVVAAKVIATPDTLDFCPSITALVGTLKNVGNQTATYTLTKTVSWLTIPGPGSLGPGNQSAVTVTVNSALVPVGENWTTIIVNTQGSPTDTIHVKACRICLTTVTARLDFGATQRRLTFTVRNTCGGIVDFSVTADQTWISVTRTDSTVNVVVDPSSLPTNCNNRGIVTVEGGSQGRLVIPVTKCVDPRPLIVIDPPALDFQTDKDSLRLLIDNEGGDVLTWSTSADSSWLWAEPSSGSLSRTSQQHVWVRINRGQMPCGAQNLKLHVTSNAGTTPNRDIAISANGNCFDLKGVVTDAQSRIAIANAKVEITGTGQFTHTDDTGGYFIPRIPVGNQTVKATKVCFTFAQASVTGLPGTTVAKDLGLPYSGPEGTCLNYLDYPISWWPGAAGQERSWEIYVPEAVNLKLHFSKIYLNSGCNSGWFAIKDARDGRVIWSGFLYNTDYWTAWLDANHVIIIAHTGCNPHGFDMDKYTYYK